MLAAGFAERTETVLHGDLFDGLRRKRFRRRAIDTNFLIRPSPPLWHVWFEPRWERYDFGRIRLIK